MRLISVLFYPLSILVLLLAMPLTTTAHTNQYTVYLDQADHAVDAHLELTDPAYWDNNNTWSVINRSTSVSLIYGREDRSDLGSVAPWWYRVSYTLYNEDYNLPLGTGTLTISYEGVGGDYENLRQYLTAGQVNFYITAVEASPDNFQTIITAPNAIGLLVPDDIRLELQMTVNRYDFLSPLEKPLVMQEYSSPNNNALNQHDLKLTWNFIPGAESYEVEWWYLDAASSRYDNGNYVPIEKDFKDAVRAEVVGQKYHISITYPPGKVYYRVRSVGRFVLNVSNNDYSRPKYGPWSTVDNIVIDPFESTKNWQYTTTFAEEGKHKKVISYFDDGLKNRQTQTNLSTDEITLVATSHYDVEGRPVVNILPVPALNNNDLFYKAKFNRALDPGNTSQEIAYNRLHFDKSSPTCNPALPDPLSESGGTPGSTSFGGAAHYFSPEHFNNANGMGIHKGYIPDANEYPMTQVRFRNDGTGRIVAQSGVGDFYQLGSGRETKYFYDDVSNFQLRRLFGSNVGDAIYYKRNIVQDANGQLSISYLDAAGRVVATALAGSSPTNTIPLDSYTTNAVDITENLLDNNTISADRKLSVSRSHIMNEAEGTVANFTYDMNGIREAFTFNGQSECFSCAYKLRIQVYDPCDALVYNHTEDITDTDALTHGCATYNHSTMPLSFSIIMAQIGLYTVVKELEVIDPVIEDIIADLTLPSPLPIQLDDLSCTVVCIKCSPNKEESQPCYTFPNICKDFEGAIIAQGGAETCNSIYYQILNQVSPEGCMYEKTPVWWTNLSGFDALEFDFGVGTVDLVLGANLSANQIADLSDPLEWRDQWGEALATIHPAYSRYVLCMNTLPSRQFDLRLSGANTWEDLDAGLPANQELGSSGVVVADILDQDPTFLVTTSNPPIYGGFYPNYNNTAQSFPIPSDMVTAIETALLNNGYGLNGASGISSQMKVKLTAKLNYFGPTTGSSNVNVIDFILYHFDDTYLSTKLSDLGDEGDLNKDGIINNEDYQLFRFQTFKGIYIGEKDRLLKDLRIDWCGVEDSDCQIVQESDLYDIPFPQGNGDNTGDAGEIEQNNQYNSICDAQVERWMSTIKNDLPECSNLSTADLNTIAAALKLYCQKDIGLDNPLGYLVYGTSMANSGNINAPFNSMELSGLENIMGITCKNAFRDVHSIHYTTVYEDVLVDGTNPLIVDINGFDIVVARPIAQEEDVLFNEYYDWCKESQTLEEIYEKFIIWQREVDESLTSIFQGFDCLDGINEQFKVSYKSREHHYTLYYYDQAGNLVQTVPPEGVVPLTAAAFDAEGNWIGTTDPGHTQVTQYQYNTLGQVIKQHSPDGGTTQFKYDYAQRLRVSQNNKQALATSKAYSFTSYDTQGRIVKVGELKGVAIQFGTLNGTQLNDFDFPANGIDGNFTDVVYTDYNEGTPDLNFAQQNLRGRVSKTSNEYLTTRYSYDAHGNVTELQHQVSELNEGYRVKVAYDYDLISGNVKEVAYQRGKNDQFYHRYSYDADNRLTRVFSSDDGLLWEKDARYFYYAHGPLARIELGQDKVQGLDYYYTLQGWIKGVNLPDLPEKEPGADGLTDNNNWHRYMPQDAMAYTLGYHQNDYRPIDATQSNGSLNPLVWDEFGNNVLSNNSIKGLFNGNISWMMTDIPHFATQPGGVGMNVMAYKYDQLHRIKNAISFEATQAINQNLIEFNLPTISNEHHNSEYYYDPNGNLTNLVRKALDINGGANGIDILTYRYNAQKPNQLTSVEDYATESNFADNHSIKSQNLNNYSYDEIGNLISDAQEGINTIQWNVFGKVKSILFANGSQMQFTYDPSGNRLSKTKITSTDDYTSTYYIRDASGNVLSVYEKEGSDTTFNIAQKEVPLYGSSRLGLQKFFDRPLGGSVNASRLRQRGEKYYELSNHLGNVLAVVSDQKTGIDSNSDGIADRYEAYVVSANDYRPFGEVLRGRSFDSPVYRYGFNGKEKDESGEWGNNTHYDYGFRIYNPSIARFLSRDPLAPSYPELTPYQFASNRPIDGIDVDGLEYGRADPMATVGQELLKIKLAKENNLDAIQAIDAATNGFRAGVGIGGFLVIDSYSGFSFSKALGIFGVGASVYKYERILSDPRSTYDQRGEASYSIALASINYLGATYGSNVRSSVPAFIAEELQPNNLISVLKSQARPRAMELQKALVNADIPPQATTKLTVNVGVSDEGKVFVSLNTKAAKDARIVTALKGLLKEGEELVPDALGKAGHAEPNMVNFNQRTEAGIIHMDTNTKMCAGCGVLLESNNITTNTPLQATPTNNKPNLFDGPQ